MSAPASARSSRSYPEANRSGREGPAPDDIFKRIETAGRESLCVTNFWLIVLAVVNFLWKRTSSFTELALFIRRDGRPASASKRRRPDRDRQIAYPSGSATARREPHWLPMRAGCRARAGGERGRRGRVARRWADVLGDGDPPWDAVSCKPGTRSGRGPVQDIRLNCCRRRLSFSPISSGPVQRPGCGSFARCLAWWLADRA